MKNCVVIGIEPKTFTFDTGEVCQGRYIYFGVKKDNVQGYITDKIFLSDHKFNDVILKLGNEFNIYYNKYGKVEMLEVTK